MNLHLTIRNLAPNEMYVANQLAEIDGRNPGLNDAEYFLSATKGGVVAALSDTQVAGTIAAVNYDDDLSFIGLHMVIQELRGNGLSEKLLSVVMDSIGNNNIGVNCREELIPLYENFGFKPAFKIITYEGITDGEFKMAPDIVSPLLFPFDKLYSYYEKYYHYKKKLFMNAWLNQPKSLLLGKYVDGEYKGFGLFKPCLRGYKAAPLISDNMEIAEEILIALASHFEKGMPFYIDMPETNINGINLVQKMNLKKVSETTRMYKGIEHENVLNNIYSFTSLEVG